MEENYITLSDSSDRMAERNWLPKEWFKAIVCLAIPKNIKTDEKGRILDGSEFKAIGTGFLISYKGKAFLVTNKHIAMDERGNIRRQLQIVYNLKKAEDSEIVPLEAIKQSTGIDWVFHPNEAVDIAIMPILWNPEEFDLVFLDENFFEKMSSVVEGDDIFFLGFPLAVGAKTREAEETIVIGEPLKITPVVRSGIISLKREKEKNFLIEANVFPGSSGSPVFLKPMFIDYKTGRIGGPTPPKLIGILFESIYYREPAISLRTGEPRVVFYENSGLARTLSFDLISDILTREIINRYITNEKPTQKDTEDT